MENASSAFLDAVRKSMRAIRSAIGSTTITPELLTSAEKLRYESYLRCEDTNTAIVALAGDGVSIKQIVRRLGHSRNLVRQTLRGGRTDVFQTRQCSLDAYYLFLEGQWSGGCRNGAELWRRLQARGFQGSLRLCQLTRSVLAEIADMAEMADVAKISNSVDFTEALRRKSWCCQTGLNSPPLKISYYNSIS